MADSAAPDSAPLRVVIATDGSPTAADAAHAAVEVLRPGAEIVLVAVIADREDPMESAGGIEGPTITEEEADREFVRSVSEGQAALHRTAAAAGSGPSVQSILVPTDEPPDKAIVGVAREHRADVLVLGSQQPGFFQRLFGGSVTDRVVHHAPCPVLVVPHTQS